MWGFNPAAYRQWLENYERTSAKIPYHKMPQDLADELAHEVEQVVGWFHDHDKVFTAVMTDAEVTDDQTRDRIQGFQYAMDREIARTHNFEYAGGWLWRFEADWRIKHSEWVEKYKVWEKENNPKHSRRYDLSTLPWNIQRALCTRWQRIWETWKREKGYDPERTGEV